ncbi:MAG: DciA family protein [Phycisphaerales bacterium]
MRPERPINLARLRENRGLPMVDSTIADSVRDLARSLKATSKRSGGVAAAWEAMLPPALKGRAIVTGIRAGTLAVRATDASARFQLDAFVRARSADDLKQLGVRRIKLA